MAARSGAKRGRWSALVLWGMVAALLAVAIPAASPTSNQVYLYEHTNYGGAYMRWDGLRDIPDLRSYNTGAQGSPNWNDRISSVKVGSDVTLILYQHINYGGSKLTLKGPANISSLVASGWNDKASSFRIVPK